MSQVPPETLYSAINNCLPHASVFTIVPKPDDDSQLSKVTSSVGTPIVDSVTDSGMISSSVDSSIITTPVMESSVSPDTSTATTPMVESSSSPDTSMVTTPVVESSVSPDTSMVTTPVMESTTSSADASISSLVTTQVVPNIPKPLLELFDPKHKKLSKEMLLQLSKEVFVSLSVTDEQAMAIELATRTQRLSSDWYSQRQGRITASLFHDVFTFKEKNSPDSLLKRLLCNVDISHIPAIKWGVEKEDTARREYIAKMSSLHQGFRCTLTGLVVNPQYPFLGASPDALVECSCCGGQGSVEIKCPFSGKGAHPSQLHRLKNSFLNETGLRQNHKYYTQVQGQLVVSCKQYCDFVVWTPEGILIERMEVNSNFTESLIRKLTKFYVEIMLPEILTRNVLDASELSSSTTVAATSNEEVTYCFCQEGEHGKMICCDNSECKISWFHFKCVGIKRAPRGDWFCPNCNI